MALLADIDDSYTKTGKGFLTRWSNKLSVVPIFGGTLTLVLGLADAAIETLQYLFRGQFGNAFTAAAAGTVGSFTNSMSSFSQPIWWGANLATGATTNATIGTHARAAVESFIGAAGGVIGAKPQILQSNVAGLGSINVGQMQSGPGKFAANVSAQRGENPDAAYARYMSGEGGVHVNELQSANGRGA